MEWLVCLEFKLFFVFVVVCEIKIRLLMEWGRRRGKEREERSYEGSVRVGGWKWLVGKGGESCLGLGWGKIDWWIGKRFMEVGKSESGVYVGRVEGVLRFGKGYGVYVVGVWVWFEGEGNRVLW